MGFENNWTTELDQRRNITFAFQLITNQSLRSITTIDGFVNYLSQLEPIDGETIPEISWAGIQEGFIDLTRVDVLNNLVADLQSSDVINIKEDLYPRISDWLAHLAFYRTIQDGTIISPYPLTLFDPESDASQPFEFVPQALRSWFMYYNLIKNSKVLKPTADQKISFFFDFILLAQEVCMRVDAEVNDSNVINEEKPHISTYDIRSEFAVRRNFLNMKVPYYINRQFIQSIGAEINAVIGEILDQVRRFGNYPEIYNWK